MSWSIHRNLHLEEPLSGIHKCFGFSWVAVPLLGLTVFLFKCTGRMDYLTVFIHPCWISVQAKIPSLPPLEVLWLSIFFSLPEEGFFCLQTGFHNHRIHFPDVLSVVFPNVLNTLTKKVMQFEEHIIKKVTWTNL